MVEISLRGTRRSEKGTGRVKARREMLFAVSELGFLIGPTTKPARSLEGGGRKHRRGVNPSFLRERRKNQKNERESGESEES